MRGPRCSSNLRLRALHGRNGQLRLVLEHGVHVCDAWPPGARPLLRAALNRALPAWGVVSGPLGPTKRNPIVNRLSPRQKPRAKGPQRRRKRRLRARRDAACGDPPRGLGRAHTHGRHCCPLAPPRPPSQLSVTKLAAHACTALLSVRRSTHTAAARSSSRRGRLGLADLRARGHDKGQNRSAAQRSARKQAPLTPWRASRRGGRPARPRQSPAPRCSPSAPRRPAPPRPRTARCSARARRRRGPRRP